MSEQEAEEVLARELAAARTERLSERQAMKVAAVVSNYVRSADLQNALGQLNQQFPEWRWMHVGGFLVVDTR